MIDWQRKRFYLLHDPIPAGRVLSIDHDGTMEWETPKRLSIRGSYESTCRLRSQGGNGRGQATELYVDVNPAKFIQGHNVFGSEDNMALAEEVMRRICFAVPNLPHDFAIKKAREGDFLQLGIHIARSFDAGSLTRAHSIQEALALKSRTRSGRCQSRAGTNYWNLAKRKTRWLAKSYLKFEEITSRLKGHKLPEGLSNIGLEDFAKNLIRIEFEIYKQELIERTIPLEYGHQFTESVIENLYQEYWERIEMSAQAAIASHELESLMPHIRSTYLMWKEGLQVRGHMSKPTFYRHRCELLPFGIDIAIPNDHQSSNVIPLIQIIEAKPVSTPQWAYEKGLIFTGK